MDIRLINIMLGSTPLQPYKGGGTMAQWLVQWTPIADRENLTPGAECGGIQRTRFYVKIRCVSDHMPYVTRLTIPA